MAKIVCISDTHTRHWNIKVPDGDVLIHAGDITNQGELWLLDGFLNWFSQLPHKYKILIGGNHDWCFEKFHPCGQKGLESIEKYSDKIMYLHHNVGVIEEYGLKIFGSPYTPFFCDWAFNIHRGRLKPYWDQIPDDIDILVTHGPCYGILDHTLSGEKCGDYELLDRVREIKKIKGNKLKCHVFGHIHTNRKEIQTVRKFGMKFVNASILNERYEIENEPVVFNMRTKK